VKDAESVDAGLTVMTWLEVADPEALDTVRVTL
jgi:hypothetical protein